MEIKNQLSFLKKQKNNYKISENNLRKKLNLKEKEINDLKIILNTNISVKSQISSINHDGKDEDNSKEIKPYIDTLNLNKNYCMPKSLSLIERKLSSYHSCINKRNLLHNNNSNKSYISKNISKNISKKEYKYKTAANIYSENNTKKTKEDNAIKIIKDFIKPFFYSNYNSVSSYRGKRLEKSESRSLISRKTISKSKIYLPEDSNNSKNILINENKNDNNKNKILINYNTNIINTNVSIDRLTIKQKMKEIRKAIDEKINEITRNKKHNIRRTTSAIYDKRVKSHFFNEKIKKKKDSSSKHKEQKLNSNKLVIKSRKNFQIYKFNSNFFRQKLQNITTQQKNKKYKKNEKIKIKFKNKNNSMIVIKNEGNEKIFSIQAYTGKKSSVNKNIYNNDKNIQMKKNSSLINLNNKINNSRKIQNIENNNKTIINNHHNTGLTYRKKSNFDKILSLNEKINKNDNKTRKKNNDIYTINNNNLSLRKYILKK